MSFRYYRIPSRKEQKDKHQFGDSISSSGDGIINPLNSEKIFAYSLEELLGPLNNIEKKYAPKLLYLSGDFPIPLPGPRLSVIGSREASLEGIMAAKNIVKTLVKNEVIVVSGLAKGIDSAAHKTAIEEGGYTIAVLGTPLDKVYPKENYQLQNFIMRNHLAISQFPIGHPTQPKDFIIRNRVMALISNGSIIVEAGDSSGSLHQGWEALRLGRPLFIWKSILDDSSLSWPQTMLKYGAIELNNSEEILDYIPTHEGPVNLVM